MVKKSRDIIWSNKLSRELHKDVTRKFRRRQVITPTVDSIWAADLLDVKRYAKTNKKYNYLLMVIDTFSKYGWIIPLKNKTGGVVATALKSIFTDNGRAPSKLWTDRGTEFYNRDVNAVLKHYAVTLYSTYNEEKSCISERWIRTIMKWLYIYFDTHSNTVYIDILPQLVTRYNTTKHRSIGCTPMDARKPENYQTVYDHLYPTKKKRVGNNTSNKVTFNIGAKVRLSVIKNQFDKGYFRKWTEEQFEIDGIRKTNPITYTVKALNGEKIHGTFYKQQLQASKQTTFLIEKIIGKPRVRNGVREVRVKWRGYASAYNQWIPESDVVINNPNSG